MERNTSKSFTFSAQRVVKLVNYNQKKNLIRNFRTFYNAAADFFKVCNILRGHSSVPNTNWRLPLSLSRPERETEQSVPEPRLAGRRLVRIRELIQQIQSDWHEGGCGCSFMNSVFVKEVEKKGSKSKLLFKCTVCGKETLLDTDQRNSEQMEVNNALTLGALAAGGGYANVFELAAALDMPCMSQPTYIEREKTVGEAIESAALESMLRAGREERRLALEAGDAAIDGTPRIRVIADGLWGKRSFKSKYDALSGVVSSPGPQSGSKVFGTAFRHIA